MMYLISDYNLSKNVKRAHDVSKRQERVKRREIMERKVSSQVGFC